MVPTSKAEQSPTDVVRLSVNLTPDVAVILKGIAARHGYTITDTVRRAVGVLDFIDKEMSRGATLAVVQDGKLTEVKVIWT